MKSVVPFVDVGLPRPAPASRPGVWVVRWLLAVHTASTLVAVWPEAYRKWQFLQSGDLPSLDERVVFFGVMPWLFLAPAELACARWAGLRGWEYVRVVAAVFGLTAVQWAAGLPLLQ